MITTAAILGAHAASAASPDSPAPGRGGEIRDGAVVFGWRHDAGRLHCALTAPTGGWIAVGFNDRAELQDTYFVIAAVARPPLRAELHVARVPDHAPLDPATGDLVLTGGGYANDASRLAFSLPPAFSARPALRLTRGERVYLMLAWSREADFDHHSAWRRHRWITL